MTNKIKIIVIILLMAIGTGIIVSINSIDYYQMYQIENRLDKIINLLEKIEHKLH